MILSSHQPNFLPYMGVIYKIYKSDIFVYSDDVQFSKSGMHNYNYIKTRNGKQKITMPVKAPGCSPISDVVYHEYNFNFRKIERMILQEYAKAEHYKEGADLIEYIGFIMDILAGATSTINVCILNYILDKFGISRPYVLGSFLGLSGHKDGRLLEMLGHIGADSYLSGDGAAEYHCDEDFGNAGIELKYTHYNPVHYRQLHGEFIENLSSIDYIFNEGYKIPEEWSRPLEGQI